MAGAGACGRVLVIDAEQGLKTIKRRLREAGLDEQRAQVDYVRVPEGLSLDSDARHVAEVERVSTPAGTLRRRVDPFYKLHRGDSNAEREAVDLMQRFDEWRERSGSRCSCRCTSASRSRDEVLDSRFLRYSAYVRGAEVVLGLQASATGIVSSLLEGPRRRSPDPHALGAALRSRPGVSPRPETRAEADGATRCGSCCRAIRTSYRAARRDHGLRRQDDPKGAHGHQRERPPARQDRREPLDVGGGPLSEALPATLRP